MKTYNDLIADTENTRDLPEDEKPEYEIISGNEKIVFIKVGAGGSLPGYENKYLRMAQRIHKKIGATVICASNPDEPHEDMDEETIRRVASDLGFEDFKLYFWGTSDGAYQNLFLAKRFPETVKWIGVNSSFITFAGFEENLQALSNVEKLLVFGTKDYEYDVVFPALRDKQIDNLKMIEIEGADHRFTDMLPQFIQTIDYLKNRKEVTNEDV